MIETRYLRVRDVARETGLSIREVWRRSRNPHADFPRPRKISSRVTVWLAKELAEWHRSIEDAK